jgi:RNA recognition motif-containing protein
MVVDSAVPRLPKEINSNELLKVKDEPEEHVEIEKEKSDYAEESSHVETGKKLTASGTEVLQNNERKKCKKIRNAKKGRLIIRNLPFKVSKAVGLFQISSVRFEVFTAVTMKNIIYWDVKPRGPCKNRRFGGT